MKDCNFEIEVMDGKKPTLNLSERGKTACLNACLSGYFVMLLRAIVSGGTGSKVLAVLGVIIWTLAMLSNNGLLGSNRGHER